MAKFKKSDIERIIQHLGGVENISKIESCATRARITLVDMNFDSEAIENETIIKGLFRVKDTIHLIIGSNRVESFVALMKEVMKEAGVSFEEPNKANNHTQSQSPDQNQIMNSFATLMKAVMKESGISFEDQAQTQTQNQNQSPDDEVTLTKKDVAIIQLHINGIIANFRSIQDVLNKYR